MPYFLLIAGILVVLSVVWKVFTNAGCVDLPNLDGRHRDHNCNEELVPNEEPILDEPERPDKP